MGARRFFVKVSVAVGAVCAVLVAWSAPAFAASAPVIDREYSSHVGNTVATLDAKVNPGELETRFHFEYGPSESYGTSVPVPDQPIAAGAEDVLVSQVVAGLQADTTYHYRVAASNSEGTVYGSDKVFHTYAVAPEEADGCPNATIRSLQFASYLPDCRAYEMVSPPQKTGGNVAADPTETTAAVSGDAVKWTSPNTFADAQGTEARGAEYVSQRASEEWVTHAINPNQPGRPNSIETGPQYEYFSPDLTKGVYLAFSPLVAGHPNVEAVPNLYLRTDVLAGPPGSYELLSESFGPVPARNTVSDSVVHFAGASADFKHIIFETAEDLTPNSVSTNPELRKLYEWHDGTVQLVGILPNGEPAEGSRAGAGAPGAHVGFSLVGSWTEDAISSDGSRIVFTTAPYTAGAEHGIVA